jgi:hypothetical protein
MSIRDKVIRARARIKARNTFNNIERKYGEFPIDKRYAIRQSIEAACHAYERDDAITKLVRQANRSS